MPCARAPSSCGRTPRSGCTVPSSESSPTKRTPSKGIPRHRTERSGHRGGEGQIEAAAGFLHVGRSQVHDDLAFAEVHTQLRQGALHPDTALSNRRFGEPDELEEGRTTTALDLYADEVGLQANEGGAKGGGEHACTTLERAACRDESASIRGNRVIRRVSGTNRGCRATPRRHVRS